MKNNNSNLLRALFEFILVAILSFLLLIAFSCGSAKIPRVNRVISGKTVNVDALRGWIVIKELKPGEYVIRNKMQINQVKMPEWFGKIYHEGDTIK